MPETIPGLTGRYDRMSRPNPTGFVQPPAAGRTETALQRRKRVRTEGNERMRRKAFSNAARRTKNRINNRYDEDIGPRLDRDRGILLDIAIREGVSEEEARSIQVRERQAKESGQRVAEFIDQDRLNSPTALIELRHEKKLEILERNRKIAEEDRVLKADATERKRLRDKQEDQDQAAARVLAVEKSVKSRQLAATDATTRRRDEATVRDQREAVDKQVTDAIAHVDARRKAILRPRTETEQTTFEAAGGDSNKPFSGRKMNHVASDIPVLDPQTQRKILDRQRRIISRSRSNPDQAIADAVEVISRRDDIRALLSAAQKPSASRMDKIEVLRKIRGMVLAYGEGAFNVDRVGRMISEQR